MTEPTNQAQAKANIKSAAIPSVGGAPPELETLYQTLVGKADEAMKWYERHQQSRKKWARYTRVGAILLGALTAIIPSLIALLPDKVNFWFFTDFPAVKFNPLATIAGVVAATLVLLDKFFGFSSGWMRYVATFQEIQDKLEAFGIDWRKQIVRLKSSSPPTDDQILGVYDFFGVFLKSLNDSVRGETQVWALEFKGALAEIDKTVEERKTAALALTKATPAGGIRVVLADHDKLDEQRWTLKLDGRDAELKQGQASAAIPGLDPGLYRLRIAGKRDGKPVAAEFVVTVKSGEIAEQKVDQLG